MVGAEGNDRDPIAYHREIRGHRVLGGLLWLGCAGLAAGNPACSRNQASCPGPQSENSARAAGASGTGTSIGGDPGTAELAGGGTSPRAHAGTGDLGGSRSPGASGSEAPGGAAALPGTGGLGLAGTGSAGAMEAGAAGQAEAEGGAGAGEELACDPSSAPAPAPVVTLSGFAGRHAFAWDSLGRLVTVNEEGDLVRRASSGVDSVWVPDVTPAGGALDLDFLPSGDLLIVDSTGALVRVTSEGATEGVLTGLTLPARLTVAPDGAVYVSEELAGRIRAVDVTTGNSEVVATGLVHPAGLAVAADGLRMYCGSHSTGIVYGLERQDSDPGSGWGAIREFARTPYAPGDPRVEACRGRSAGDGCTDPAEGVCAATDLGLTCTPAAACQGRERGAPCTTADGQRGECREVASGLDCGPLEPCRGLGVGDACVDATGTTGICAEDPWEERVYCAMRDPCGVEDIGAPCTARGDDYGAPDFGVEQPGLCREDEAGRRYCDPSAVGCAGATSGESCQNDLGWFGTCADDGTGVLACQSTGPCAARAAGDSCTENDLAGVCTTYGDSLVCRPRGSCDALAEGDPCSDPSGAGVCADVGGSLACSPPDPCAGLREGDSCTVLVPGGEGGSRREGTCVAGALLCSDSCGTATDGECDDGGPSALYDVCRLGTDCADCGPRLAATEPSSPRPEPGCTDTCSTRFDGECDDGGPDSVYDVCALGTDCTDCGPRPVAGGGDGGDGGDGGTAGVGAASANGIAGDTTAGGSAGSAVSNGTTGEGVTCLPHPACEGQSEGEPCVSSQGRPGVCDADGECRPANPCLGVEPGAPCKLESGQPGSCTVSSSTGNPSCEYEARAWGELGALALDPCGFVYVAEDGWGKIWRISPDGTTVELVVELPAAALPNAAWGTGSDASTLYFIERDRSYLYAIPLGGSDE